VYIPEAFREEDHEAITAMIRSCGLATLVTHSAQGMLATPLPMIYAAGEGEHGVLYGHIAIANPQWKEASGEDGLVLFQGPNAYITPAWYATKGETGKVVPTWNYIAVHAYGPVEFFHDPGRLLDIVSQLTQEREAARPNHGPEPWSVNDAPADYVDSQLRSIVGLRIPIRRLEAKKKLSQNQPAANRASVKQGLCESLSEQDQHIGKIIPL
jgi:transcriptional regulator